MEQERERIRKKITRRAARANPLFIMEITGLKKPKFTSFLSEKKNFHYWMTLTMLTLIFVFIICIFWGCIKIIQLNKIHWYCVENTYGKEKEEKRKHKDKKEEPRKEKEQRKKEKLSYFSFNFFLQNLNWLRKTKKWNNSNKILSTQGTCPITDLREREKRRRNTTEVKNKKQTKDEKGKQSQKKERNWKKKQNCSFFLSSSCFSFVCFTFSFSFVSVFIFSAFSPFFVLFFFFLFASVFVHFS